MRNLFYDNIGIWSGVAASGVLAWTAIGLSIPIWASLLAGVGTFGGVYLMGYHSLEKRMLRQADAMSRDATLQLIKENSEKISEIRSLSKSIRDKEIKEKISSICTLADQIIKNFEEDPSDLDKARRFLLYIDRFLSIIQRYARLSSTEAGRELLEKTSDDQEFEELLDSVKLGFKQGFQNYLRNDVVELRTFGRVLKKMMNVAEIGD